MASIQDAAPAVAGIIGSDPVVAAEEAPAASAVIEVTASQDRVFSSPRRLLLRRPAVTGVTGPDAIAADVASE